MLKSSVPMQLMASFGDFHTWRVDQPCVPKALEQVCSILSAVLLFVFRIASLGLPTLLIGKHKDE